MGDTLPNKITMEMIDSAIVDADNKLIPADEKSFAVILSGLFEFAWAFDLGGFGGMPDNIRRGKSKAQTKIYQSALGDVPVDVLKIAIDKVCAGWKWGNRMPLPADIRAEIREDMAERTHCRARLKVARSLGRLPSPPVDRTRAAPAVAVKAVPLERGEKRRDRT